MNAVHKYKFAVTEHKLISATWMLGASFAFAGMAALIKLASNQQVHITQILFYRGLISVLLTVAFLRVRRIPMRTPHLKAHLLRGFAGFLAMLAYIGAIGLLPLATAVTLNYLSPVLLAVMLLIVHRERPTLLIIAAMLGGLGGVALLSRPIYDHSQWLGGCLSLLSALLGAFSALNIRMLGRLAEPPARTVLYFSLFILCVSLPPFLANDPSQVDPLGLFYVCAAAAFATLGQWMITVAYQHGHTLTMSLLGYTQVVFSTLLDIAIWNNVPPLVSWLGIALIIGSGAAAIFFSASPAPAAATPDRGTA